ncbi:MAG: aminotransferase class I/II-fold pyridoxal phosphate-dependent enzyme [Chloroflexi bacterium]|nr:MAG: aminotransferase class I/II-fold pyridoxal phosphate-dependent enzyme [Chloroflexota bacterium]
MRTARVKLAARTAGFTESVIREMTRLNAIHGGINLAQGFPNFAAPQALKDAAKRAIDADINQYAITWGAKSLRDALSRTYAELYGMGVDPETMLTVTCGATEAMVSTLLALVDPGDEVIVLEPFYENYGPDTDIAGARPIYVALRPPENIFDRDELRKAFGPRTKAIIVNTPNNPTGRVFTRDELTFIASLCVEHDVVAVTDEIYEHIRIVAPAELTAGIRKVHDFVTVGAPAPLQEAVAEGLSLGRPYYDSLATEYRRRRDVLVPALEAAGFAPRRPEGAYYVLCDITPFGFDDDTAFARWLVSEVGVAGVPGSSFYSEPALGKHLIRFTFCKTHDVLAAAAERLARARELAAKAKRR